MLFNDPRYFLLFLPACLVIYFLLYRQRLGIAARGFLVAASLGFYSYWNPANLPLILASILGNYLIGAHLSQGSGTRGRRSALLAVGICANLLLLGYYKYADFLVANWNALTGDQLPQPHETLPLAISFFTFLQIAYLVVAARHQTREADFLSYSLFVTFFPHLIAGPLVHHSELMPAFRRRQNHVVRWDRIALGLYLFTIGLAKKVLIADHLAEYANLGFARPGDLTLLDGWTTSLAYTFQIYFDFSGYSDMAVGASWMFNIRLPDNFNAPYRAGDIQEFWRRWHITLSRWLREYLYIPLGGNRRGPGRTTINMLLTMLLGGLWHGAAWTFIAWGGAHGLALAVHRVWQSRGRSLPPVLAWMLTFLFVNATWVLFRAASFGDALAVYRAMLGLNGVALGPVVVPLGAGLWLLPPILIIAVGRCTAGLPERGFRPSITAALFCVAVLFYAVLASLTNAPSQFLYFNF